MQTEELLHFFPKGIVALDLETTGLSPMMDKIIEIACIKVNANGTLETFQTLVNPEIPIPELTIKIHGITDKDVAGQPKIDEVFPHFLDFCRGLPIIAHNAKFDIGFLVYNNQMLNLDFLDSKIFCSVLYSRKAFPDATNYKLGTLAKELQIPLENHHRALDDTFASLMLLIKGFYNYKIRKNKIRSILEKAYLYRYDSFNPKKMKIPEHLKDLHLLAASQTPIEIKYSGGSMKNQFRPVRPTSLLPMPDGAMLYALCLKSNIYKTFSLKKVKDFRQIVKVEEEE